MLLMNKPMMIRSIEDQGPGLQMESVAIRMRGPLLGALEMERLQAWRGTKGVGLGRRDPQVSTSARMSLWKHFPHRIRGGRCLIPMEPPCKIWAILRWCLIRSFGKNLGQQPQKRHCHRILSRCTEQFEMSVQGSSLAQDPAGRHLQEDGCLCCFEKSQDWMTQFETFP